MPKYEDYVINRKKIADTKAALFFERNNLSAELFTKNEEGYFIKEPFCIHSRKGVFKCVIKADDIRKAFSLKNSKISFRGHKNNFGISICLPWINKSAELKHEICNFVEYWIYFEEKKDIQPHKKKKKRKYHERPSRYDSASSWAVSHPFQGGGCSPR